MKCPIDGATLQMTTREGVEIDYCPECRGVWLDRGELDKIVERSTGATAGPAPARYSSDDNYHDEHRRNEDHDRHYGHDGKKRRKESFLGDLFDF